MTLRLILAATMLAGQFGCRSLSREGDSSRDPLHGRYIPKQDLPIPDRRDPLYTSPASSPKTASANREPFRNSTTTTPARLAANVAVEDSGLSLGDRRTGAETATRGVPLRRATETVGAASSDWQRYADELHRLRARYEPPQREPTGEYSITATVPSGPDGALRRYEAVGPTAADAARQLIQQIRADEQ